MAPRDCFEPYAPDVRAVVRLGVALPVDHSVHLFVDLVRAIELGRFAIPSGPTRERPYRPHAPRLAHKRGELLRACPLPSTRPAPAVVCS